MNTVEPDDGAQWVRLIDVLRDTGLSTSLSNGRQLIAQHGVHISITPEDPLTLLQVGATYDIRVGKRKRIRVRIESA